MWIIDLVACAYNAGIRTAVSLGLMFVAVSSAVRAELPSPILNTVFPAGGQAGTSVTVTVEGSGLDDLAGLHFADNRLTCKKGDGQQFILTIPSDVPTGIYDARTVGKYGLSGPRAFIIGNLAERIETESNDKFGSAEKVPLDCVVNGRLDKPGDIDCYRFIAVAGQRVVLDFWSERIDSKLRGVVEVYDAQNKRLAVNRGRQNTLDPLVDFLVPEDGAYVVKVFDHTFAGSEAHFYRLDIDTGPRPEFIVPAVVRPGKTTRVTLVGRNLRPFNRDTWEVTGSALAHRSKSMENALPLDYLEVDVTPPVLPIAARVPLLSSQFACDAFPYRHPGGNAPVLIGLTDVPIESGGPYNRDPNRAQPIAAPVEICGQLTGGDERHWYVVRAQKGEVLWLEAFGARIGAPVDLDIVVLDAEQHELLRLDDGFENLGGARFSTTHSDPSGKFVSPADGKYLIMVRNLIGGLNDDPRRVYRLGVRREDPSFDLAAIPRRADQSTGINIGRGSRELLEVVAIRHRGMAGSIRVSAENLPAGIHCPDVWLGPGAERAPLIVSADLDAPPHVGALNLTARARAAGVEITRPVRAGAMVWPSQPTGWGRLTDEISFAVAPESPLLVTVTLWEARVFDYGTPRVFQNSSIDLAVSIDRRDGGPGAPIRLKGVGLPPGMHYQTATIPAGGSNGWISFSVPASLLPGPYTIAIQADTEVPSAKDPITVTTFSNPITVHVEPERIRPEIDPLAPRKIARGKAIKIPIRIERKNGFIGKILGEVIAPGGIVGLQARGVAFESQLEAAEIQVVAADRAPLGTHAMLRLELVGMWEDRAVCRGTRFIDLEITE